MEGALEQARKLLSIGDFGGVQRICDRYLRKYPGTEDFMALARELGKRREEQVAAYRAGIASRLAAEPNLNAQANILEEALSDSPKDEYFEQEMARVKERQNEVKAAVARARGFEKQQAFEAAIKEWENLLPFIRSTQSAGSSCQGKSGVGKSASSGKKRLDKRDHPGTSECGSCRGRAPAGRRRARVPGRSRAA